MHIESYYHTKLFSVGVFYRYHGSARLNNKICIIQLKFQLNVHIQCNQLDKYVIWWLILHDTLNCTYAVYFTLIYAFISRTSHSYKSMYILSILHCKYPVMYLWSTSPEDTQNVVKSLQNNSRVSHILAYDGYKTSANCLISLLNLSPQTSQGGKKSWVICSFGFFRL